MAMVVTTTKMNIERPSMLDTLDEAIATNHDPMVVGIALYLRRFLARFL